jgi:antitoxin PrlF
VPIATMTSKGQVTIPKSIRDDLHLRQGDQLEFRVTKSRRIDVDPAPRKRPLPLAGMLRAYARDRPVTVEEMNAAIAQHAADKFVRATRC